MLVAIYNLNYEISVLSKVYDPCLLLIDLKYSLLSKEVFYL